MAVDRVNQRVASILLSGAARAYDFPRRRVEEFDPQLCHRCQRVNSVENDLCASCAAGETVAA